MRNLLTHKLSGSRLALLLALVFCLATTNVGCTSQREKALSEVKAAITKKDTRFVTVHGYTVTVPGIPDGAHNGLVLAHGKKPPIGVGDAIRNPLEGRQQDNAVAYAHAYNTFLLKHLLDNPDQKTKSFLKKVRLEMNTLEGANARADALRAFNSSPKFIHVFGEGRLGYPIEDSRTAYVDVRHLQMNAAVLRGSERQRFERILKTYVVPYNQILYQQLKKKWDREGVKDPYMATIAQPPKHNYVPPNGYVPDTETAIRIAVAIWSPIYGEENIQSERPYKATLRDGVWVVQGSLPKGWIGGVALAEISKKDGRIIRVSHGK